MADEPDAEDLLFESIDYLHLPFSRDFDKKVEELANHLKERGVDFDTMVGTGLSGALVIPTLARKMGKFFFIVRKDETTHSTKSGEGRIGRKWIFVDDLVYSGATHRRVRKAINAIFEDNGTAQGRYHQWPKPQYVGILTYYYGPRFQYDPDYRKNLRQDKSEEKEQITIQCKCDYCYQQRGNRSISEEIGQWYKERPPINLS